MKKEDLYHGISGISEKYLNEADNYRPQRKRHWKRWVSIAACLCLVVAAAVITPTLLGKHTGSPFVLTAYALGNEDSIITNEMIENKSIPVSLFETPSGIKGFVFSYDKITGDEAATVTIVSGNKALSENPGLDEILLLSEMESGKRYFYYIPDSADTAPYQISFFISDPPAGMVYRYDITIDETAGGHIATLSKTISERLRSEEEYSFDVFAEFEITEGEDGNKEAELESLIGFPDQE